MKFSPPETWQRITTIDAHTAGEPLRVITGGYPQLPGETMLDKREYARRNLDHLRRALMLEPRGHADMYGCVLTAPVTSDGDVGVVFLHNDGYSTMCGHGIIGLVKVGIEGGLLEVRGEAPVVRIDTPAGRVTARAHFAGRTVQRVSFRNVASFVLATDLEVDVPELGVLRCDIAFGGAFYAYLDAAQVGLEIEPENYRRIIDVGMRIKRAVMRRCEIAHPDGDPDLNFLYGTILVQPGSGAVHSRNVCVFADGEVDRSPTGTSVSARLAIHHARGEIATGERIVIESIVGSRFSGRVIGTTEFGGHAAVLPEVSGSAHLTGRHELMFDPDDPLQDGFILR